MADIKDPDYVGEQLSEEFDIQQGESQSIDKLQIIYWG